MTFNQFFSNVVPSLDIPKPKLGESPFELKLADIVPIHRKKR